MKPRQLFAIMLSAASILASAEEPQPGESVPGHIDTSKLKVTPIGRILMDANAYFGGNGNHSTLDEGGGKFVSGVAIPEIRVGGKVSYGKWKAKVDVGYAYQKVCLNDVFIEYDFDDYNLVRLGYMVMQFGLNSCTSSSMKPSMEEMVSNKFFNCNPQSLGVMYEIDRPKYLGAWSIFVDQQAMLDRAQNMGKEAWGIMTRQVWRPHAATGDIIQAGLSVSFQSPPYNSDPELNHNSFTYSAYFPTRVSQVTALDAVVTNARSGIRLTPELLLCKGRIALESQYYYAHIFRKDGYADYKAQGAYACFRGILKGTDYTYNHQDGGLAVPDPGCLEVVAGYNYTNANDVKAGIRGGILNDFFVTFNYHINPWMIVRLRYSYTDVRSRTIEGMLPSRHVNSLQARLQILF